MTIGTNVWKTLKIARTCMLDYADALRIKLNLTKSVSNVENYFPKGEQKSTFYGLKEEKEEVSSQQTEQGKPASTNASRKQLETVSPQLTPDSNESGILLEPTQQPSNIQGEFFNKLTNSPLGGGNLTPEMLKNLKKQNNLTVKIETNETSDPNKLREETGTELEEAKIKCKEIKIKSETANVDYEKVKKQASVETGLLKMKAEHLKNHLDYKLAQIKYLEARLEYYQNDTNSDSDEAWKTVSDAYQIAKNKFEIFDESKKLLQDVANPKKENVIPLKTPQNAITPQILKQAAKKLRRPREDTPSPKWTFLELNGTEVEKTR